MKIAVLPDNLIDRIAAGEVVERPASVVKELLDNALDAGATEISVLVEGNGTSLIRVSDDGEGVAAEDVPVAFERHSTSKIKDEADLAGIATMGFRGEALPSIASVAAVEMVSRPASEEAGCRYRVENGRKGVPTAAGCPVGTTVEVRDLFFHVPARLKFMKAPRTEIKYVTDVVNHTALAHPSVHFRLHHGGKRLADYVATTRLQDRVRQVFGDAGSDLVPFSLNGEHLRCTGFASQAPKSFGNSRYMVTLRQPPLRARPAVEPRHAQGLRHPAHEGALPGYDPLPGNPPRLCGRERASGQDRGAVSGASPSFTRPCCTRCAGV